jgi:hypothetical protein
MSSDENRRYYTAHLRFTLQIRIGNVVSEVCQEEFSGYLQELETLRDFVSFADEFYDISVGSVTPFMWSVSFSCKGELPVWIDDPVTYAIAYMKNKFGYAATTVYMGLDPVSFVLEDVVGMEYEH